MSIEFKNRKVCLRNLKRKRCSEDRRMRPFFEDFRSGPSPAIKNLAVGLVLMTAFAALRNVSRPFTGSRRASIPIMTSFSPNFRLYFLKTPLLAKD